MPGELIDIFNENMEHIGTADRAEVHAHGYWHQSFHCWLIQRIDEKLYVLFQRRGPDKKLYPNTLDITAAGHLIAGESPEQGIRELNEELGLSAKYEDLIPLGIRCDVVIIGNVINREFCHTFLLESNLRLNDYNLQLDEVSGIVRLNIEDGLRLFADEVQTIPIVGYQVDKNGEKQEINIQISKGDIIPRLDPYYTKVFIMAERYFQGIKYLGI